jgi:hypothetical protein
MVHRAAALRAGELHAVSGVDGDRAVGRGDYQDRDALGETMGAALGVSRHPCAGMLAASERDDLDRLRHPDEGAPRSLHIDQTLGAELPDRLPDSCAADAVLLDESQLAGERLTRPELARLDLVAQQIGQLPEDSPVRRGIDHGSHRTWPRYFVALYVQTYVEMMLLPR